jgi:hypothetical protein
MNGRMSAFGFAVLVSIATAAPEQASQPEAGKDSGPGWGSFRLLVERNIFLRDRASARPRGPVARARPPVVRDPDDDLVLTGIVGQGEATVAFVENTRTNDIQRLWVGDTVGAGRISGITLDDIEYVRSGASAKILIGQSLGDARGAPGATATTRPAEAVGERPDRAAKPSEDTSTILERMRRRREQELQR